MSAHERAGAAPSGRRRDHPDPRDHLATTREGHRAINLDDLRAAVGESSEQHHWTDDDNVAVLRALLRDPDIKNNDPAVHALADQIGTTYTSVWRTIENFRGLRSGRPTPGQTNTSASQRRVWERWGTTPWHQLPTPAPPPRTPEEQARIDAVVAARMEERRRNR